MVVFHLKRMFFDMIRYGDKTCEYRFKVPDALRIGSLIRFDLGYRPLSDLSAHLYARCTSVDRVRLLDCPSYVFDCFGIEKDVVTAASTIIYRIGFGELIYEH